MAAILLQGPATEPVTLAQTKAHLKLDANDEDELVQTLITAARLHVETLSERVLMSQQWRIVRDCWPRGKTLDLPIGPVTSVDAVRVYVTPETVVTIDPASYLVETASLPARLAMQTGVWPRPGRVLGGIEIDITAGYGTKPNQVPAPLRQAVLLLAAHWHTNREPVTTGDTPLRVPGTVDALINAYRRVRL